MLRFTIREIVLLTVIVAMAVGWYLDSRSRSLKYERFTRDARRIANERDDALKLIEENWRPSLP